MSQDLNYENGQRIKAARLRLGMSQFAFAALIPVDRAYLSELENGRQTVQEWHLDKAEKIVGEHDENYKAKAPLPGRRTVAPGASELRLVLETIASALDSRARIKAMEKIAAETRLSVGARSVCAELLGAKARGISTFKFPKKISGLSSKLTAAQRAAAKKQQALGRRGSQGS